MRKVFTLLVAVFLTASVFAQSPEKMSYQAVIRDASDNFVTSQAVGMQISILQGSASGTAVYVETQTPTTNANGLVSIEIGTGTIVSGNFSTIDWATGPYFIKAETDLAGGTSYSITGTSQLLSVPYSLHAKTAETITGGITETDPVFTAWDKTTGISITESQISDLDHFTTANETDPVYGASVASGITATDTTSWNNKLDSETDPTFTSSQAANINATDITNLSNLSGVNTGDQDLSALATKTALGDSTAQVRSEIPDVSGFLTSETDPTVPAHVKAITTDNILDWNEAHGWGNHSAEGYATKNMNSEKITNLGNPTNAQDAATKAYVDALEAKLTFLELKVDLSAGASVSDLIAAGASVSDLVAAGASVSDLVAAGASVSDLVAAGASVSDLVAAGASVSDLVAAGTSVSDLVAAGASVSDLVAAGATNESDYIGLTYQGGIIFYVDVNGTGTGIGTGLIASTADQSTGIQWYNGGSFTITGATATALGTGNTNTNTIVTSLGTGSYAAQLCADLSEGGYDDWYLPSKDELNKLYLNRTAVGGFASAYYWSSTEYDKYYAWRQNLDSGNQNTNVVKNGTLRVRAVRAF